jgi:3-hydroxyacyl-CoA dehydrogenase/enoyl-CoA hydratase/3-hydroxybutyryl-CoA epimerase
MGVENFVHLAEYLGSKYGKEFAVPQLLKDMAAKGETFYTRFDPYAGAKKAA